MLFSADLSSVNGWFDVQELTHAPGLTMGRRGEEVYKMSDYFNANDTVLPKAGRTDAAAANVIMKCA